MAQQIFLLGDDGTLRAMTEAPYPSEERFQQLLESHSELLAGDQMSEGTPRRWLLISRELGVPDELDGTTRWALDHLFVEPGRHPDASRGQAQLRHTNTPRSCRPDAGLRRKCGCLLADGSDPGNFRSEMYARA